MNTPITQFTRRLFLNDFAFTRFFVKIIILVGHFSFIHANMYCSKFLATEWRTSYQMYAIISKLTIIIISVAL